MHVNTNLHKYINSSKLIDQKISLVQKYWENFPNLQIKTFRWPFFSLRKLTTQVQLFGAFAVRASGPCYVSREINRFSKSFQVANIKNAGFSKLKTWFLRFETRFVRDLSIVPVLSRHTTLLISLPNLSGKIEGPPLVGHKLINNNIFKDNSFQQNLVLDILTNFVRVTLTKKVTFRGKIHC